MKNKTKTILNVLLIGTAIAGTVKLIQKLKQNEKNDKFENENFDIPLAWPESEIGDISEKTCENCDDECHCTDVADELNPETDFVQPEDDKKAKKK